MAIDVRVTARLSLALFCCFLAGCFQGVAVDVQQSGSDVIVAIKHLSSAKPACVDRLSIYRGNDQSTAIWEISTQDSKICVDRFTLGSVPAGFVAGVAAAKPRRGVRYQIDVSGADFMGGTTFTVGDRDGQIGDR